MRRTRGHVGALLDRLHERRDVPAVHLEVHVEVAGDLAPRGAEAVGDGGSAAAVRVVEDHAEVEVRVGGHDLLQDRAGAVAAHVVDEDHLERPARPLERLADLGEARAEVLGLVVAGEHEAQVRGGPAHARDPVSRTAADDPVDVVRGEPRVQRQAEQRRRHPVGHGHGARRGRACGRGEPSAAARSGTSPGSPAPRSARRRRVAQPRLRVEEVEDVVVRPPLRQLGRQAHAPLRRPVPEALAVAPHDLRPQRLDPRELVELGVEDRGEHVREHVARALRHPGVLVHLPAEEGGAVRALLARDLGPARDLGVGQHQRAALAAGDVLGLVEAEAAGVAERAERASRARWRPAPGRRPRPRAGRAGGRCRGAASMSGATPA